jgi:hypothetical protein
MDSTANKCVKLSSRVYMCLRTICPVQNECIREICQEMDLHKNILQTTHKKISKQTCIVTLRLKGIIKHAFLLYIEM